MFAVIEDPRSGNATRHPFGSILFIALSAVLCGMDTCEDFVRFAKARREWLEKWIDLPDGIPCAQHLPGVFAAIDPRCFVQCIAEFVAAVCPVSPDNCVALDACRSFRAAAWADENTVQIVSAWACQDGLTLAQRGVDGKSNEITAVPKLLRHLNVMGCGGSPRRDGRAEEDRDRHPAMPGRTTCWRSRATQGTVTTRCVFSGDPDALPTRVGKEIGAGCPRAARSPATIGWRIACHRHGSSRLAAREGPARVARGCAPRTGREPRRAG
ncbi:MAG: ISAs1 family transposase [Akkermansiaceae bacterium]|nr:ISAs1 family transposase [Akkermansiaceae bacterium]